MATIPNGLYPFATRDGQSIPLDIIEPLALIKYSFTAVAASPITIPASFKECMVYSSEGCILQLGSTLPDVLVGSVEYIDAVLILPSTPTTLVLKSGVSRVLGISDPGTLYIQSIRKWAGLALSQQFAKG